MPFFPEQLGAISGLSLIPDMCREQEVLFLLKNTCSKFGVYPMYELFHNAMSPNLDMLSENS